MEILQEISTLLQQGRAPKVKELVAQALETGIAPKTILEEGLLSGMNVVGEKFKNNQVFIVKFIAGNLCKMLSDFASSAAILSGNCYDIILHTILLPGDIGRFINITYFCFRFL